MIKIITTLTRTLNSEHVYTVKKTHTFNESTAQRLNGYIRTWSFVTVGTLESKPTQSRISMGMYGRMSIDIQCACVSVFELSNISVLNDSHTGVICVSFARMKEWMNEEWEKI